MEFRTTFTIEPSPFKITHRDPVMFIGSCFASSIGEKMREGKIPVMINPSGTVYNPVSAAVTLDTAITGRKYQKDDLFNYKGTWLSFDHYTDFSSLDFSETIESINDRAAEANTFFSTARFLFITFGTARVYRHRGSSKIVSNCHKLPASEFNRELLTVDDITGLWSKKLEDLKSSYPELQVVFSVSPVRHMKDGAHGNQISKSTLFLAVEKLLDHPSAPLYFPAYELLMDDLRDYRFYDGDMLHPSGEAVNYIWDAFVSCYFSRETRELWKECSSIEKGMQHRLKSDSPGQTAVFANAMLGKINIVSGIAPSIDFKKERSYFASLLREV
jgi:hypothetical protein